MKIDYPNKSAGDSFYSSEANTIKTVVNHNEQANNDTWRTTVKFDDTYTFVEHKMSGAETWTADLTDALYLGGEVRDIIGDGNTITLSGIFSQSEISTILDEIITVVMAYTGNQIVVNTITSDRTEFKFESVSFVE